MRSSYYEIFKTLVKVNYHGCDSPCRFRGLETSSEKEEALSIDIYYDPDRKMLNRIEQGPKTSEVRDAGGGKYFQTYRLDVLRTFVFFEHTSDLDFVFEHAVDRSFRVYHPELDIIFMHAACVEVSNGEAALFTAPSGGGKSTFCSLAEGRGLAVRGDEACAIKRVEDKYYAGFFPSFDKKRDIDESVRISEVFYLNKAQVNGVEKLTGTSAIKKVLPEATWLSEVQLTRTAQEYRSYVFEALQSMYDRMPFKLLNFTLEAEKMACLN